MNCSSSGWHRQDDRLRHARPGGGDCAFGPDRPVQEVIIKASAGDVPELDNFLYTGVAVSKEYAEKNPDVVRRWVKAVNKANVLMRKDEAAALKYLKKYFPRMPDDVMALAMKEIMPALSADGTMNEQMMQKHLDFLKDTEQVDSTPSGKEGVLWTNAYLK